jgi:hypothetical protein
MAIIESKIEISGLLSFMRFLVWAHSGHRAAATRTIRIYFLLQKNVTIHINPCGWYSYSNERMPCSCFLHAMILGTVERGNSFSVGRAIYLSLV